MRGCEVPCRILECKLILSCNGEIITHLWKLNSQTVQLVTFGMVTKEGSEVPIVQSDPGFAITEGAGTDVFLFCALSTP